MGIKIIVDNNFFDNYESYPDDKIKRKIETMLHNRRLSFYPSLELIIELLGMWHTERKELLSKYANMLLSMTGHRVFNEWNRIIRVELGIIRGEGVFLNNNSVNKVKDILRDLSQKREEVDVDSFLAWVNSEKQKWFKIYKDGKDKFLGDLKLRGIEKPAMNFNEFYKMDFAVRLRRDLVKDIFNRVEIAISDTEIDKILDFPTHFPYFHTSLRVLTGLFYLHLVKRRSVDEGDYYDQYYPIYLTNLDYLVSNDSKLKILAEDVFTSSKKVINFSELVKLVDG